jgi:hypothetical protein
MRERITELSAVATRDKLRDRNCLEQLSRVPRAAYDASSLCCQQSSLRQGFAFHDGNI